MRVFNGGGAAIVVSHDPAGLSERGRSPAPPQRRDSSVMRWIHISLIARHELSVERRAAEVIGLVVPFASPLMTLPCARDRSATFRVGFRRSG